MLKKFLNSYCSSFFSYYLDYVSPMYKEIPHLCIMSSILLLTIHVQVNRLKNALILEVLYQESAIIMGKKIPIKFTLQKCLMECLAHRDQIRSSGEGLESFLGERQAAVHRPLSGWCLLTHQVLCIWDLSHSWWESLWVESFSQASLWLIRE